MPLLQPFQVEEAVSADVAQATLPIDLSEGVFLDPIKARDFGAHFAARYKSANPYPHIVFNNFLPLALAEDLLTNFPKNSRRNDVMYEGGMFQHGKRQVFPNDCNEYARNMFGFFNSASVLAFLEALTGIEGLISDPHFDGGGFHEIFSGGKLGIHADFRINRKLGLNRRLNLIIYLNKGWERTYGGELEIWDKAMKTRVESIAPLFNRCVIFSTEKDSYHGHPDPLNVPENVTRKSMALYYYTASRKVVEETPTHGTIFYARPEDGGLAKRGALVWRLRSLFSLSEWLPPIIYRGIRTMKNRVKKSRTRA